MKPWARALLSCTVVACMAAARGESFGRSTAVVGDVGDPAAGSGLLRRAGYPRSGLALRSDDAGRALGACGARLPSGRLLAAGGVPAPAGGPVGPPIHSNRAELLDTAWTNWTEIAPMPAEHRWQQQALRLASGKVMVVGEHPDTSRGEAHFFDEVSGRWTASANSPERRRFAAELVALAADRVLYLAGYDGASDGESFTSAEDIYGVSTNQWEPTGSLAEARFGLRAVLLRTGPLAGRVLACGGMVYDGSAPDGLVSRASCEVYDPARGDWAAGPSMGAARSFFTLTELADGRLLAVGGRRSAAPDLASCEIFDPATVTWLPTAAMPSGRARHAATLLPSGRVLVTGSATGRRGDPTTDTAFFDPAAGTWVAGPAMIAARSDHGMQLGSDGRVIVVGGRDADGEAMAATEILDLGPDGDGPAVATATGVATATVVATATTVPTVMASETPTTVPTSTSTAVPTARNPDRQPHAGGGRQGLPPAAGQSAASGSGALPAAGGELTTTPGRGLAVGPS